MRERKLTTLIAGPIIFESSSRETTISRRSGEHFPGYGPGIGRLDMPLDAFRENLDPEHRGAIAEEIFAQVKDDFGGLGQNLLLQWLSEIRVPGEFLLTSLEFGRVVIESELKESNVCVYSGDTHSRNWNSDHSIPLSLDHAREYWSAEESATYCASAFRECRDVLDAEYPGGADQAEWELELWFG